MKISKEKREAVREELQYILNCASVGLSNIEDDVYLLETVTELDERIGSLLYDCMFDEVMEYHK